MNIFNNSGSLLVVFVLMVINWIFWNLVTGISKRYYKNRIFRKIGVFSSTKTPFRIPILHVAVEGYTDLLLAAYLGMFDFCRSFAHWTLFRENFSNFSNTLTTLSTIIVSILITGLPFYIKYNITKNFKTLG